MYIRGFDGLRALAIVLVFLTHKTAWGNHEQVGFSGVWLFFLLSGFLISGQLRAARARIELGQTSLRREIGSFWIKRAMRIFPAYYVVIALVVPLYLLMHRDIPGLAYYLSYFSNFYFQFHPAAFLTTFAHFWSLAVEEQYYVFFAPLILLVPMRYAGLVCTAVLFASLIQRFRLAQIGMEPYIIYIDSLVNFGLLASGGLLYIHREILARLLWRTRLDNGLVGWAAMVGIAMATPLANAIAGPNLVLLQACYVLAAILAALLLVHVYVAQTGYLANVLEWQPVAYVGRISYGLYLYNDYVKADIPERVIRWVGLHVSVSNEVQGWIDSSLRDGSASKVFIESIGLLVCVGILLCLAQLSWTAVEKPALRCRDAILSRLFPAVSTSFVVVSEPKKGPIDIAA